ncbi:MAG TPA: M4 family metallopeptidase [Thermoanaerobaculia bacterium]|nr:M4 family metallopeptidase [Thermoanaerobaculia bacterium]
MPPADARLGVNGSLAEGDTGVSAIGMEPAAKIFYRALTACATPTPNDRLMRDYTLQAAAGIYQLYLNRPKP